MRKGPDYPKNTQANIAAANSNERHNAEQPMSRLRQDVLAYSILPKLAPMDILNLNATCRFFHKRIPKTLKEKTLDEMHRNRIPYLMDKLAKYGQEESYLKAIFVGERNDRSGKGDICRHYGQSNSDLINLPSTIGVDFLTKTWGFGNDRSLMLQLWDTAAQERFNTMMTLYFRNANIVVCVANSNEAHLEQWITDMMKNIDSKTDKTLEYPVARAVLINTRIGGNNLLPEQFSELVNRLKKEFGENLLCYEVNSDLKQGINEALDNVVAHALYNKLQSVTAAEAASENPGRIEAQNAINQNNSEAGDKTNHKCITM